MKKSKAYTLEAPDGGWGILVCIGMALPFVSETRSLGGKKSESFYIVPAFLVDCYFEY